jgi:hypothetical protein
MKLLVATRQSDIASEHGCNGELIQKNQEPAYVYIAWCSGCGSEFRVEPDSDRVTFVPYRNAKVIENLVLYFAFEGFARSAHHFVSVASS